MHLGGLAALLEVLRARTSAPPVFDAATALARRAQPAPY